MRRLAPTPLLNNLTPALATNRLVCARSCVRTTLCIHHVMCALRSVALFNVQLPALPTQQLATFDAGASPRTPIQKHDSCGVGARLRIECSEP